MAVVSALCRVRLDRLWASWMLGSMFSCPRPGSDIVVMVYEAGVGPLGEKGSEECTRLGVRDTSAAAGDAFRSTHSHMVNKLLQK